jgi:hypothetical protein
MPTWTGFQITWTVALSWYASSQVTPCSAVPPQVPHTPATPALLVPVRDESAPAYPVPGLLPSKAVVKLVGKRRGGASNAHMRTLQFTQGGWVG